MAVVASVPIIVGASGFLRNAGSYHVFREAGSPVLRRNETGSSPNRCLAGPAEHELLPDASSQRLSQAQDRPRRRSPPAPLPFSR